MQVLLGLILIVLCIVFAPIIIPAIFWLLVALFAILKYAIIPLAIIFVIYIIVNLDFN